MAPPEVLEHLQTRIQYRFSSIALLERTFEAGDTNGADQEGHRGLAQLGDSLMATAIMSDGLERGRSRKDLQDDCSRIRSKDFCGRIAKILRLPEWIKLSERQVHVGIQPKTLKNAVAALIGAVWLDSHDYNKVLQVMSSIGLMNHAQYIDEHRESLADTWSIDQDLFTFPEPETIATDDYLPLFHVSDANVEFPFVAQPTESGWTETTLATPTQHTLSYTPPSSPESAARSQLQDAMLDEAEGDPVLDYSTVPPTTISAAQPSLNRGKQSHVASGKITKPRSQARSKKPGRSRKDSSSSFMNAYVQQEMAKAGASDHSMHVEAMSSYMKLILQAPAASQLGIAVLVSSIGDSSSLLRLKGAIKGLRSSQTSYPCVNQRLSISDRMHVIEQIGACSELLRLIRWLHVLTLWEDMSRAVQHNNAFVVSTPASVVQQTSSRRGNPKNLALSDAAQGFAGMQSSRSASSLKRLRRLGQRLKKIAIIWGAGALLLLGQDVSDEKLLTGSDEMFDALLALMNQMEGARISAISAAALPIVQSLEQGGQALPVISLESATEDSILALGRLSHGFESLLMVDGDS